MVNRTGKLVLIPVALFQLVLFLSIARHRLVDGDEGFYLLASRLVFDHKIPYRDFFFTQMPLLPYCYGLWLHFTGASWLSARALAAGLTAALGALLYIKVSSVTGRCLWGIFAVVLFVSNTHIFAWFTVAKTYSLSTLLLFVAYFLISRFVPASPGSAAFIAGLFLGLATDVRLYMAGLVPVFLVWLYRNREVRAKGRTLSCLLGGVAIGVLPNAWFVSVAPQAFFFDVLGFHLIHANLGFVTAYSQKLVALIELFSPTLGPSANGLQTVILFATACVLILKLKIHGPAEQLAFQLALSLGIICLMPTPSLVQYFCVCIPFLIVAVVCSVSALVDSMNERGTKRLIVGVSLMALVAFVSVSVADARSYLVTGNNSYGIASREEAVNWRIDTIVAVSRGIEEVLRPGEQVMSLWPGYIFQSHVDPYPGLENHTGLYVAPRLSPIQLSRYRIISRGQVEAEVDARRPQLFVVGNQDSMGVDGTPYTKMLAEHGYRVVRVIADASIYERIQ